MTKNWSIAKLLLPILLFIFFIGTAGNTGIGLAHMCLTLGYKCVIYIPDDQTVEKIDMLKGSSLFE